jgi:hypothetical protein
VALKACRHGNSGGAAADDQDFMVRSPGHDGSPVELGDPQNAKQRSDRNTHTGLPSQSTE